MKKLLICLLVLLLMTCSGCTETMTVIEPLDMRVYLSQTEFTGPKEVAVSITVYNLSDEDRQISADLKVCGLEGRYKATELWSKQEICFTDTADAVLRPHASAIYRLEKMQ